ncbi:MAG: peroxide stress protein YaaA [Solobacterium sp.]|nr:peroxide stress protein YaaA [Solobacterium sp.]
MKESPALSFFSVDVLPVLLDDDFMKIILSPAKKMIPEDTVLYRGLPCFIEEAEYLRDLMKQMDREQLKELWKCSDKLVMENTERLEHMDLRRGLSPAVLTYSGLAYQHMAPDVMTDHEMEYLEAHLCILSGLYGVLKPFDGVRPYRLEMQALLSNRNGRDLYSFWGDRLYKEVCSEHELIVDLASKEYSSAVVPYLAQEDHYVECVFAVENKGKLSVKGTLAKMARGSMVRWMAETRAENKEDLKSFDRGWTFSTQHSSDTSYVFLNNDQ